ncbi:MAG: hypothetical protein WD844_06820 [Thermoleophilaceae bacterium]
MNLDEGERLEPGCSVGVAFTVPFDEAQHEAIARVAREHGESPIEAVQRLVGEALERRKSAGSP